jgi:hypothetical protein
MSEAKKLSYKWEKRRRGLATFILRWGERDSDYVYVRGGYWIDDVPRKEGGYKKVPMGIGVDSIGRIRYVKVIDTSRALIEREYEVRGDGRFRSFACKQFDYDYDTEQGLKAKRRAARYMNWLMEYLSTKAELACKHPIERRKLWPSSYFSGMALCETCQEWAHDPCKKCGHQYCEKHLKTHRCQGRLEKKETQMK